jgi:hypothetical protein
MRGASKRRYELAPTVYVLNGKNASECLIVGRSRGVADAVNETDTPVVVANSVA